MVPLSIFFFLLISIFFVSCHSGYNRDVSCDLDKLQENAKTYGVDTLINAIESEAKAAGAVCTRK